MLVPCLLVDKVRGEEIRGLVSRMDLMDKRFRIRNEDDQIIIPLKEEIDLSKMNIDLEGIRFGNEELKPRDIRPDSFKDILDLPDPIMERIPSSFDLIGDVAIIKLEADLKAYSGKIGEALLSFNRKIRSVATDNGVKGDFRVRDLTVISGEQDLETVHIENNLRFQLDPSKVYFSPRLATERMRVAGLTGHERVLDMFSGVGPFALTIGRHSDAEKVIGIDLNPDCIRYFQKNIEMNFLDEKIEAYLGDSSEISAIYSPFDRVIMNLPHSSMGFLNVAIDILEKGVIHLYMIIENDSIMSAIGEIMDMGKSMERTIQITGTREVHNYSPSMSLMVFDLFLEP